MFATRQALRNMGPMHDNAMRRFACTFQLSPRAGLTSSYPESAASTFTSGCIPAMANGHIDPHLCEQAASRRGTRGRSGLRSQHEVAVMSCRGACQPEHSPPTMWLVDRTASLCSCASCFKALPRQTMRAWPSSVPPGPMTGETRNDKESTTSKLGRPGACRPLLSGRCCGRMQRSKMSAALRTTSCIRPI